MLQREEGRMLERQNKTCEFEDVQNRLSERIAKERREKEEMENVRMELCLAEQEEENRQKEIRDIENRIRVRIDLQETMQQQQSMKERKKESEKAEEEDFRQQMLAKFAYDEHIELMNAKTRRMKQLEHGRAVEKLIEERRATLQREKERELNEHKEMEQMDALRKEVVEEERRRMLREHATKLLGYLPKGVLRDRSELELFDAHFKDVYAKRKFDYFEEDDDGEA